MKRQILLDTGPLVAVLNRKDRYHGWAAEQWAQIQPPLLTCEPVLAEACFLLRHAAAGSKAMMELLHLRIVKIAFDLEEHLEPIGRLLSKYASVPMSFADACLVRLTELYPRSAVLTLDADFRLYRKHRRQVIPLIMPDDL